MKRIIVFLIALVIFSACKKEDKVDPAQIKKEAVEEAKKEMNQKMEEAKARTYDFSLRFTFYDMNQSYMDFPYIPGDETIVVFLRDETLNFQYHAMPYIDLDNEHLYSYSISDTGGLLWCTVSDLNGSSRYGTISPAITRNFRAVLIPSAAGRVSKDWSQFGYEELKELFGLQD